MKKRFLKSIEISIHLLIWLGIFVLLLLQTQNLGVFNKKDGSIYIPLAYGLMSNLALFYINSNFLIPKYIPHKRIAAYIRGVLVLFLGITIIETSLDHFISINIYSTEKEPFAAQIILNSIINGLILSLSIGYGFVKHVITNENQKQKLMKDKLNAELNFLKSQINPHFLFNTLNMAYASALKHGDEDTSDIIEKLSGLLRYNLYECNDTKVELEKELDYLENYIDLQTKRLSEDIKQYLKINIVKSDSHHKIAPLILIPFIENVFKHGIILSHPGEIQIRILVQKDTLTLFTKNPIMPIHTKTKYGGIGNKNVKNRLALIYKNKYHLITKTEDKNYIVELSLEL